MAVDVSKVTELEVEPGTLFALWLIGGKPVHQPAVPEAAGVPAADGHSPATHPAEAAAVAEMADAA